MKVVMMNNKKWVSYFFIVFFILVIGLGCTKTPKFTELTATWKFDPSYTVRPGKILVVGKLLNESNRIPFEDSVVSELKIKNLKAFASYKALPSGEKVVKEQVKIAAHVMGIKSVLVTRVVSVGQKDGTDTTMSDTLMMGSYLEESNVKTTLKVRIESGLFDVESEKLVWAANSRMLDPGSIDAAIEDYTLAIMNQLSADGIIP